MLSFTTYCTKSADFKRKEGKHQDVNLKGQKEEGWENTQNLKANRKNLDDPYSTAFVNFNNQLPLRLHIEKD